jgi:epoxyqueuosine reductase QueG
MYLENLIRTETLAEGASLVASSGLGLFYNGKNWAASISIAVALNPSIVAGIPSGPHEDYSHEYDRVNRILDNLGTSLEQRLMDHGFAAYAITTKRADRDETGYRTQLPHKTAARLAGLGWIGKNALLVTKEFGCALRLTTVLTDAPLPPNEIIHAPKCNACRRCADVCPGGAIKGRMWSEELTRDDLVNAGRCSQTTDARGLDLKARSATCGMCLAVCPHTLRYISAMRKS